jgi:hypothetical protein
MNRLDGVDWFHCFTIGSESGILISKVNAYGMDDLGSIPGRGRSCVTVSSIHAWGCTSTPRIRFHSLLLR